MKNRITKSGKPSKMSVANSTKKPNQQREQLFGQLIELVIAFPFGKKGMVEKLDLLLVDFPEANDEPNFHVIKGHALRTEKRFIEAAAAYRKAISKSTDPKADTLYRCFIDLAREKMDVR